jgi:hypothetical protein
METVHTSETLVYFKDTARRCIPEGYCFHALRRENLKSHTIVLMQKAIYLGFIKVQSYILRQRNDRNNVWYHIL